MSLLLNKITKKERKKERDKNNYLRKSDFSVKERNAK